MDYMEPDNDLKDSFYLRIMRSSCCAALREKYALDEPLPDRLAKLLNKLDEPKGVAPIHIHRRRIAAVSTGINIRKMRPRPTPAQRGVQFAIAQRRWVTRRLRRRPAGLSPGVEPHREQACCAGSPTGPATCCRPTCPARSNSGGDLQGEAQPQRLQDQVLKAGLLTLAELEDFKSLLDSPEYRWVGQMTISVWLAYLGKWRPRSRFFRWHGIGHHLVGVSPIARSAGVVIGPLKREPKGRSGPQFA